MIKLFINGTECKDFDWKDFSININRDRDNRIVRVTMPQKTTLRGDAYAVVRSAFSESGWCATLPVVIQKSCGGGYKDLVNGLIFLNDCEFRTQMCEVDVPIRDDSFFSRIYNNSDIEINPDSDKSKNGETITACTAIDLDLFRPSTGVYNSGFTHLGTRKAYDLGELLAHQIQFMSDGDVSLISDWYDNIGDTSNIAVVKGYELRMADALNYKFFISHRDVTTDINRLYNLWQNVDGSDIRLEERDYFFGTTELFALTDVKGVTQLALAEEYYSTVELGSAESTSDAQTFPLLRFLSFESERYGVSGTCNIDNRLTLKCNTFITDTNVIEDVLMNDNDAYDDSLFLIQYGATAVKATKGAITGLSGNFYNEDLLNGNVLNRYVLAGNGFSIVNGLADKFRASSAINGWNSVFGDYVNDLSAGAFGNSSTTPPLVSYLLPTFDDETTNPNFDTNSRWSSGFVYTASVPGEYSFRMVLIILIGGQPIYVPTKVKSYIYLNRSVGTDFIIEENGDGWDAVSSWQEYTSTFEWTCFLGSGETIGFNLIGAGIAWYNINTATSTTNFGYFPKAGSYIECTANPTSQGDYTFGNAETFKSSLFRFDQKLTDSQVTALLDSPGNAFTFDEGDGIEKKVWVNDVTISIKDNFANIEAISDIANS